jgi:hypothetical protein
MSQKNGGRQMPRLTIAVLGTIAVSLSLGAAQLALGSDLSGAMQGGSVAPVDFSINRASKGDRADKAVVVPAQTRTIALRLNAFSDTSFLVRLPVPNGPGSSSSPSRVKPGNAKAMVACEPVVSLLTEVARQLQPGRCMT